MDRSSGSGVFARDPDALLDLIELDLSEDLLKQEENKAVCKVCEEWLEKHVKDWDKEVSQDDRCSQKEILPACDRLLGASKYQELLKEIVAVRENLRYRTAWRIDGTLREFPKFKPVDLWFNYPTHQVDHLNILKDTEAEGDKPPWQKAIGKRKPKEVKENERKMAVEVAWEACNFGDEVTVKNLAEYMGVTEKTVRSRIKEQDGFTISGGIVGRKKT